LYYPILVYWNLRGEEVRQGRSKKKKPSLRLVLYLFMALVFSDKYKFQKHRPPQHSELAVTVPLMKVTNAFAQIVVAESYTFASQILLHPAHTPYKYLPSHNLPELHATMQRLLHDKTFEGFRAVLVTTPVWHMTPCRLSTDNNASHDDVGNRLPRNGGYLYIKPYNVISQNTIFKEKLKFRYDENVL
jgi:hypothetical protein